MPAMVCGTKAVMHNIVGASLGTTVFYIQLSRLKTLLQVR